MKKVVCINDNWYPAHLLPGPAKGEICTVLDVSKNSYYRLEGYPKKRFISTYFQDLEPFEQYRENYLKESWIPLKPSLITI